MSSSAKIYAFVGGAGSGTTGGFNGGANSVSGGAGAGGSDFRIGQNTLYARVIVAGGGGGGGNNQSPYYDGTCGGGLSSPAQGSHSGANTQGGASQTAGGQTNYGTDGIFGAAVYYSGYGGTGAGGGGWYGGACGYGGVVRVVLVTFIPRLLLLTTHQVAC